MRVRGQQLEGGKHHLQSIKQEVAHQCVQAVHAQHCHAYLEHYLLVILGPAVLLHQISVPVQPAHVFSEPTLAHDTGQGQHRDVQVPDKPADDLVQGCEHHEDAQGEQ